MPLSTRPFLADQPATYVIEVHGVVPTGLSERLGDMRITPLHRGGPAASRLVEHMADQAALMSVLTYLYDRGMPLLSVTRREG